MNRNRYRLVRNTATGLWTPVAETARGRGKSRAPVLTLLALLGFALPAAGAELPVPCGACGNVPGFVSHGSAHYGTGANQALVSQVGNKAILNWQSFNVGQGNRVTFQQVQDLAGLQPVAGADFSTLNRIWQADPSVIAGMINVAAGQKGNLTFINHNGIVFTGTAQVDVNTLTASSLGMADTFFLDQLVRPSDASAKPQFEGTNGFIKVLEGARITAAQNGRVMLLAPTVTNRGRIDTPEGQTILGAGEKVYLAASGRSDLRGLLIEVDRPAGATGADGKADYERANAAVPAHVTIDGQSIALTNSQDKLGHASNFGDITAARGNVTLAGLAVNQMGRASATTSVLLNGSIHLKAGDNVSIVSAGTFRYVPQSSAGGRVTLGQGSRTAVLPDLDQAKLKAALDEAKLKAALEPGDLTQAQVDAYLNGDADPAAFYKYMSELTSLDAAYLDATKLTPSRVEVTGQDLRMEGGALLRVPAGEVSFRAVDNPSLLDRDRDPLTTAKAAESTTARLHIAAGARLDVSGLTDVALPVSRNYLKVKLLGDELKDSPLNRGADSAIRGDSVWVDLSRGAPLIANLKEHQAGLGRSIAERSTAGGTITLASEGEAVVRDGATLDVSGGNMLYTPDHVKVSRLFASGKIYDMADAPADIRYDGIATQYTADYGRWGVKEVHDLSETRYSPGYREGKDAGAVELNARRAYFDGAIRGNTVVGDFQARAGKPPAGARFLVGRQDTSGSEQADFGLLQTVALGAGSTPLAGGFGFGSALPDDLRERLALNARLFGGDGVNRIEVYSNRPLNVEQPIKLAAGGSINLTAAKVNVNADIVAPAGQIGITAVAREYLKDSTGQSYPKDQPAQQPSDQPWIVVNDGVTLSTRGRWVNDYLSKQTTSLRAIDAGNITLAATSLFKEDKLDTSSPLGNLAIGNKAVFDVTGGGYLDAAGKLSNGNGGNLTLSFRYLGGSGAAAPLQDHIYASSVGKGGAVNIIAAQASVGAAGTGAAGVLHLDPGFFTQGFSSYNLTGLGGVTVKQNTVVQALTQSRDLLPAYRTAATDAQLETFSNAIVREDIRRAAANLNLKASVFKDRLGAQLTGTLHDVIVESGATLRVDPAASINLSASRQVLIQGKVHAPAGKISLALNKDNIHNYNAADAIWLGADSTLSVAGVAKVYPDRKGLLKGEVLPAGEISLNADVGYLVAEKGSLIDLSGAPATRVDIPNAAGGIGIMVASDAGKLKLEAREGMLIEANFRAAGGGGRARGGTYDFSFGPGALDPRPGYPDMQRIVSLRDQAGVLPASLKPGDGLPAPVGGEGYAYVDLARLKSAGFEHIGLRSRNTIRFDQDMVAGDPLALTEIKLNAPHLDVNGHRAALAAQVVRIGNFDKDSQTHAFLPATGFGTLAVNAAHIDLVGNTAYSGAAALNFKSGGEIRASGAESVLTGKLKSVADINFSGTLTPASAVKFDVETTRDVSFLATATPVSALSAFGELKVKAANITNSGAVVAPYGRIVFDASGKIDLTPGSLTSTAGLAQGIVPYGTMLNGREWQGLVGTLQAPLSVKSVFLKGSNVVLQQGATVDLSGAGDLQAWEFTPGPGGSTDVLAAPGVYAILPGYKGVVAPYDSSVAKEFDRQIGDAVYLAGGPGFSAGVYTLLPARYALLPGAYMINLTGGQKDLLPAQSGVKDDGTLLIAGYLTDTRSAASAPKEGRWTGYQLLSHDNVLTRAEYSLAKASEFFVKDQLGGRPGDAGVLSIQTQTGLTLQALLKGDSTTGRGASLDISAPKLAIVSNGAPAAAKVDATALRVDPVALSKLGAESLLLGGIRTSAGDQTKIEVGASTVELANDQASTLKAREVILAAQDKVELHAGSSIVAEGETGDVGTYTLTGNGALVRAAATDARIIRSGSNGAAGDLVGHTTASITSAGSVLLDATRNNNYQGALAFLHNGVGVAGSLTAAGPSVSFGDAPSGTTGLIFSRERIAAFDQLEELTLRSYGKFDFYGPVTLGGLAPDQTFRLGKLTLEGAGIFGHGTASDTVRLNAGELHIANPDGVTGGNAAGKGKLEVTADRLVLGDGRVADARNLKFEGFDEIDLKARGALLVAGQGIASFSAPGTNSADGVGLNLAAGLFGAETKADYKIVATAAVAMDRLSSGKAVPGPESLGSSLNIEGTSIKVDADAVLPSGRIALKATTGDLVLGPSARVSAAGAAVQFFDQTRYTSGGEVVLSADNGMVETRAGSEIDVSVDPAALGEAAGLVKIDASKGKALLAGVLKGQGGPGAGGRFQADVKQLNPDALQQNDFSSLNAQLETGGFTQQRNLRVREGDLAIALGDSVTTRKLQLTADAGKIDVYGRVDASGEKAGKIELYAKDDVTLHGTSKLDVRATGVSKDGGRVLLATTQGSLDLKAGSVIDVSAASGGVGGEVALRAPRNGTNNDLAIKALASTITGADKVVAEGFMAYTDSDGKISAGEFATATTAGTWFGDAKNFMANTPTIENRLGVQGDPRFQLLPGVEINSIKSSTNSSGDLSLESDWSLHDWRFDPDTGQVVIDQNQLTSGLNSAGKRLTAGVLTLRSPGKLTFNGSLSDGFDSHAAAAKLRGLESWGYRLVSGADLGSANPLAVVEGGGDFVLNQARLIRSGSADIDIAAGGNFDLGKSLGTNPNAPSAVIYTAGAKAPDLDVFDETYKDTALCTTGRSPICAGGYFVERGGDINIDVGGSLRGAVATQLYSDWLFRAGRVNADGNFTLVPPGTTAQSVFIQANPQTAWWVNFGKFEQGIAALGGGNVDIRAGGNIEHLSASVANNGRMNAMAPDPAKLVVLGGGDLTVRAGKDILSGQFYVANGDLSLRAGGDIGSGRNFNNQPVYPLIALGNARANLEARRDVALHSLIDPMLLPQSFGSGYNISSGGPRYTPAVTYFGSYTGNTAVEINSLAGDIRLGAVKPDLQALSSSSSSGAPLNKLGWAESQARYSTDMLDLAPATLEAQAYGGKIVVGNTLYMQPAASGNLTLLAKQDVELNDVITMSDSDPALLSTAAGKPVNSAAAYLEYQNSTNLKYAVTPIHQGDPEPVRIYAAEGDIKFGGNAQLILPKRSELRAGGNIESLSLQGQNLAETDITRISAGGDLIFKTERLSVGGKTLPGYEGIRLGGPGLLDVSARKLDLGTARHGIVTRGNLDNPNLPATGAGIRITIGVPGGLDYAGALQRLVDKIGSAAAPGGKLDDTSRWQARWLTGDESLNDPAQALAAIRAVQKSSADSQEAAVRKMLFTALVVTGRDYNKPDSDYAGSYARGYATLELVFPGIDERDAFGGSKNYPGELNMFSSRIKTEDGEDIEFLVPGGQAVVGLTKVPRELEESPDITRTLGMVAVGEGDVRGMAYDDILVNQSRILTLGGGDVLLWSSRGNIDAGKGKRTATNVPPPITRIDPQTGALTIELQGAASGSGIGALSGRPGVPPGDVDLIAPKGSVDAGDAGIRARNLNIAALVVLNAGNIQVSGTTTGAPVADTSGLSAGLTGNSLSNSQAADEATGALRNQSNEAQRTAEAVRQALNSFKPGLVTVEVLGFGDCDSAAGRESDECRKAAKKTKTE